MKGFAICLLWTAPLLRALDFTPIEVEENGEGGKYQYLQFADGEKRVTYMPPRAWSVTGTASVLKLTPPLAGQADVDIEVQPLIEPLAADPQEYDKLARANLPAGATKVESSILENPLDIDGRKTIEVTLRYSFFGQPFCSSSVFLARDKELLRFRVAARANDFTALRRVFHSSLHSMAGF
jgi:hypothetical protein